MKNFIGVRYICNTISALALLLLSIGYARANTYYVTTTGNDGYSGSSSAPWLTVTHAAQVAKAGDTVYVGAGTYNGAVNVLNSGTSGKPITFEPISGQTVYLTSSGWGTVVISGQSYITVSGFDITNTSPNDLGGEGAAGGTGVILASGANHITIIGNYVHDCGCGGIASYPNGGSGCDYLAVEYNYVANNAHTSGWHGSGISLYGLANLNTKDTNFHNYVAYNYVYLNSEVATVKANPALGGYGGPHTDGNGIIMDTCGNCPPTDICNNSCYSNGGRGVYAFGTNNCYFANNTCYNNVQDSTLYNPNFASLGELAVGDGSNNTFTNNIAFAHGWYDNCNIVFTVPGFATSTGNTFTHNCYYNGSATFGTGDIYANPLFVNAGADDFLLQSGSPAAGDGADPTPK
jgi:parallel beta-helix repeat protein